MLHPEWTSRVGMGVRASIDAMTVRVVVQGLNYRLTADDALNVTFPQCRRRHHALGYRKHMRKRFAEEAEGEAHPRRLPSQILDRSLVATHGRIMVHLPPCFAPYGVGTARYDGVPLLTLSWEDQ